MKLYLLVLSKLQLLQMLSDIFRCMPRETICHPVKMHNLLILQDVKNDEYCEAQMLTFKKIKVWSLMFSVVAQL